MITGLPAVGKTSLAIALAHDWLHQGWHPFILHTDILKVSLRFFLPELAGITDDASFQRKLQLLGPFLQAQWAKAEEDGYSLIIEGTLALGFQPPSALYVVLQLAEQARRKRIPTKHPAARANLERLTLNHYRQALQASITSHTLCLCGDRPLAENIRIINQTLHSRTA